MSLQSPPLPDYRELEATQNGLLLDGVQWMEDENGAKTLAQRLKQHFNPGSSPDVKVRGHRPRQPIPIQFSLLRQDAHFSRLQQAILRRDAQLLDELSNPNALE
jgi:hypothetical protein